MPSRPGLSSSALTSEINQPFWKLRGQGPCPLDSRLVGAQKTALVKDFFNARFF